MSSSSATPISMFECLTIDPQMSPTNTEIRSRAIQVRDILSSFNRTVLPSEFKPHIFTELDRPFRNRPPITQWTIQEDLEGTLLHWGAYNDQAYALLSSLQSDATRARCFYEKITRRFEDLFNQYDRLGDGSYSAVSSEIVRIAQGFRDVVAAVKDDSSYRELGQESTVRRLLDALLRVCHRHMDHPQPISSPSTSRRGTRRTASSSSAPEGPSNLFEALIKSEPGDPSQEPFMIDVLEAFPTTVFIDIGDDYSNLTSLLHINHAPASFRYRMERLLSRANTETAPVAASQTQTQVSSGTSPSINSPVTSITSPSLQTQAQAGAPTGSTTRSKRSADDPGITSTGSKRGRKKKSG